MKKMNLRLLAAGTALAFLMIGSAGPAAMDAYAETYSQGSDAMQDYLNFLSGQAQDATAAAQETTPAAQETAAYNQGSTSYDQGSSSSHWSLPSLQTTQEPEVYSNPNSTVSGNPFNDTASGSMQTGGSTQTGGTSQGVTISSEEETTTQTASGTPRKKQPFVPPVMGETPDRHAVTGGYWETLQSGEWVYYLRDGSQAKNVWVSYKGKYYYIDYSGCMMRNNYSADGYWVLGDGSWDRTSEQRTIDQLVAALSGRKYGTSPYLTFDYSGTGSGQYDFKVSKIYSFGYTETMTARPVGYGVYILLHNDGQIVGQFSVSPERDWVILTEAGFTENYRLQ